MRQIKIVKQLTNRSEQSFQMYLADIAKTSKLITADEEAMLAHIIATNKGPVAVKKAADELTVANLRFVVSVAKQYQHQGMTLSELVNEGNLGLIKAAYRFDATKGFKFISYAVWWVRQQILQSLAENSRMIRLPLNKVGDKNRIKKVVDYIEQTYETTATTDMIIEHLAKQNFIKEFGYAPDDDQLNQIIDSKDNSGTVRLIEMYGKKHVSYDQMLSDDTTTSMVEMMEGDGLSMIYKNVMGSDLKLVIDNVLKTLHTREKYTLIHFYGLQGNTPKSLEEIADDLDLTRERVRQIKEKALRQLRHPHRNVLKKLGGNL